MIQIGTVISGYRIYGILGDHCVAENIAPRTVDSWAVWKISEDGKRVYSGQYFHDKLDAEWEFASYAFPWFQDNVNIDYIEDENAETAE